MTIHDDVEDALGDALSGAVVPDSEKQAMALTSVVSAKCFRSSV